MQVGQEVEENSLAFNSVMDWDFEKLFRSYMRISIGHCCTKTRMSICTNEGRRHEKPDLSVLSSAPFSFLKNENISESR